MSLSLTLVLTGTALAQTGGGYDLTWSTVDGGGVTFATGSGYKVGGTIGQADPGKLSGGGYFVTGGFWIAQSVTGAIATPQPAAYPHDRRKNRYISFDPNKAGNDGTNVAFKVTLTQITQGSCSGGAGDPAQVDFCREDRGADDCNTCAGATAENSCISQPIDCNTGGTCTPTGEICVNDAPNSGGSNVGTVWWVGPVQGAGHLLVSQSFRMESTAWENPVHAGDCEVVPEARYGIRAVDVGSGSESAELLVETTRFAASSSSWWADCVGQLKKFCGGDIRTAECANDGECTAPDTCDRAWTLPDGSTNFDDVAAALAGAVGSGVQPDLTWVDLRGPVQASDPPNGIVNFPDIGQIVSAFGGFPYKGYDPKDCPDVGAWP